MSTTSRGARLSSRARVASPASPFRPASTISSRPRFSPAAGAAVIPAALVIEVETVAFP